MPTKSKYAGLSNYELLREENIKRNVAFLQTLGLEEAKPKRAPRISTKGDSSSSSRKKGRRHSTQTQQVSDEDYGTPRSGSDDDDDDDDSDSDSGSGSKRKRRKKGVKEVVPIAAPTRRSSRQAVKQGGSAEGKALLQLDDGGGRDGGGGGGSSSRSSSDLKVDHFPTRKKVTAVSLRDNIDDVSPKHSVLISNEAIVHCVYRLSSMSEKALGNRVRTIRRAGGKNAKEKLMIFHYGLHAAGLEELAAECKSAMEEAGGMGMKVSSL